ncbi:MAG: sigma 54-interacting transcriptional regulator [Planctomycetes bacterium]|nr:sigma 54-interacting transcriptional regulator [Planctomycetota bacterium]
MSYLVIRELGAERSVPITEADMTVGRSRQNGVKLFTEQASRHHCRILRLDDGRYQVRDIQSSNGTFVNGQRIDAKDLADGDAIGVGGATIVFRAGDLAAPPAPVLETATSRIPIHDRSVQLLLQTVIGAASAADVQSFLVPAVDNVIEITEAERGILFTRDGSSDLKPVVLRDAKCKTLTELVGISRSIPQQVFESRKAIFLLDTEGEKEAVASQSVSIYHLRTVMCAPLRVGDKVLGVLYVDNHAKAREYSATDLAIFEAVANYLALTIENMRAAQEARRKDDDRRRSLEREIAVMRAALERRRHLIGECPGMRQVYDTVRKVAPTEATVLLLGESGTGKEAIAHVLHDLSPRSEKPFVVIDCAAIPETLLESELFGYQRGAFTGAQSDKPGKFEIAGGGTRFLDEIGELSPALQAKLLRALEQRIVTRVGGVDPISIDVRIVAATNRNLEEMVSQGKFRQDLLFRFKVVSITLPPLRERGEDILLLADFFLRETNEANGRSVKGLSEESKQAVKLHRWEGNIRELKNRIEQAVILTDREYLSTEDLNLAGGTGQFHSLESARDQFERAYIVKSLAANGNNVTHTARALDISRQHLQNLIKKYGIQRVAEE